MSLWSWLKGWFTGPELGSVEDPSRFWDAEEPLPERTYQDKILEFPSRPAATDAYKKPFNGK